MATGTLLVRLADGARQPFAHEALISLFDGAQRRVHWASHAKPNIEFTIPVTNGPNDMYRVVVTATDHRDAGQRAIPVRAGVQSTVHVMLLPKRARPVFRPLAELDRVHRKLKQLVENFLLQKFAAADEDAYQRLQSDNPEGLMTLLSIASAFADFNTPDHPLDFVDALIELRPDRFFAEVVDGMKAFLEGRPKIFKDAASLLHPGAFASFKDCRFPEGNVQFTFARIENSANLKLDSDIDLFAGSASHLLLEVVPNDLLNPSSTTDPRRAYAMRWMSVERQRHVTDVIFDPPFTLIRA